MAQSLNALAVGALVKDTGTLYNGKPIIWKIADKGTHGLPVRRCDPDYGAHYLAEML